MDNQQEREIVASVLAGDRERFYDDRTFEEIAGICGISLSAANMRVYRGLERLQREKWCQKTGTSYFAIHSVIRLIKRSKSPKRFLKMPKIISLSVFS